MKKAEKAFIWEITNETTGKKEFAFTKRQFDFLTSRLRKNGAAYSSKRVPRGRKKTVVEEAQ